MLLPPHPTLPLICYFNLNKTMSWMAHLGCWSEKNYTGHVWYLFRKHMIYCMCVNCVNINIQLPLALLAHTVPSYTFVITYTSNTSTIQLQNNYFVQCFYNRYCNIICKLNVKCCPMWIESIWVCKRNFLCKVPFRIVVLPLPFANTRKKIELASLIHTNTHTHTHRLRAMSGSTKPNKENPTWVAAMR